MKLIKTSILLFIFILAISSGASAASLTIGSNSYDSFDVAVAAAQGSEDITIRLDSDITLDTTVIISDDYDNKLTIDLNGNNITAKDIRALWVQAGDVTLTGTGTIFAQGDSENSSVIRVGYSSSEYDFASLTVDNGVIISSDTCYGITVFGSNLPEDEDELYSQQLIFNGNVSVTGKKPAISGNSTSTNYIVISPDAVVSAKSEVGIHHTQSGDIVIYGGTIEGTTALELEGGSATIYSGDFAPNTDKISDKASKVTVASTGYAVVSVINSEYKGPADVTIIDGIFRGEVAVVTDTTASYNPTMLITGGTFTNETFIDEKYLVPGYVVVKDSYYRCSLWRYSYGNRYKCGRFIRCQHN